MNIITSVTITIAAASTISAVIMIVRAARNFRKLGQP